MVLFPDTKKKLKGKGRKILAAFSVLSSCIFIGLLPATIFTSPNLGIFWFLVGVGYFIVFALLIPSFVMAIKLLDVEKTLFNDYANWPLWFHWGVIILSLSSVLVLAFAKLLVFYRDLGYKQATSTSYGE